MRLRSYSRHISLWNKTEVAAYLFYAGVTTFKIDIDTTPRMWQIALDNSVDGQVLLLLDTEGWRAMGLDAGSVTRIVLNRDLYLSSFSWPPTDVLTVYNTRLNNPALPPANVTLHFILEELNAVDEIGFEFEITFSFFASWHDSRIFAPCDQAGIGGFEPSDPCRFFFQPRLQWRNTVPDPHPAATSAPHVLSDVGFTTNGSYARRGWRMRQKFDASFQFQQFPYDSQDLTVVIEAAFDLPAHKLRLQSQVRAVCDAGTHPGHLSCTQVVAHCTYSPQLSRACTILLSAHTPPTRRVARAVGRDAHLVSRGQRGFSRKFR